MTFNQVDIVVVPFPFTETSGSKKSPVIVLGDAVFFNTEVVMRTGSED